MKDLKSVTVFWFRRDLRLHDNHGLFEALKNLNAVLPVLIFDKNILDELPDKKDKRVSFIHRTLNKLTNELQNQSSSLLIVYDEPLKAFKTICSLYTVKEVFTNNDDEPYALDRDLKIREWLKTKNISFHSFRDQTIFEKEEVLKSDGTPYTIFTPYSKIWKQKLARETVETFPSNKLFSNLFKTKPLRFPSLIELGFEESVYEIPSSVINKKIISNYHLTRNFPAVNGTSKLSIHLRFGTVSIRTLTTLALETNEQWLNELIWRDFL